MDHYCGGDGYSFPYIWSGIFSEVIHSHTSAAFLFIYLNLWKCYLGRRAATIFGCIRALPCLYVWIWVNSID